MLSWWVSVRTSVTVVCLWWRDPVPHPWSAQVCTLSHSVPTLPEGLSRSKATPVCLIGDSYPASMMVESRCHPITQGVRTPEPLTLSCSRYWASSSRSLTSDKWKSGLSGSCQVTHTTGAPQRRRWSRQSVLRTRVLRTPGPPQPDCSPAPTVPLRPDPGQLRLGRSRPLPVSASS